MDVKGVIRHWNYDPTIGVVVGLTDEDAQGVTHPGRNMWIRTSKVQRIWCEKGRILCATRNSTYELQAGTLTAKKRA